MCNEALEALLMMSCKPIDRITTERSTYGTETIGVAPRFGLCNIVDGCEVVTHALTGKIACNLLVELLSEAWDAMTIGQHNGISIGLHDGNVPASAPELAHSTFGASLAIEDGGNFEFGVFGNGLVEACRISNPYEHRVAIGALHPTFLNASHVAKLSKKGIVLVSELSGDTLLQQEDFVGLMPVVTQCQQLVAYISHSAEVVVRIVADAANFTIEIDIEHLRCAITVAYEGQGLAIGSPDICLAVVVVICSKVLELACIIVHLGPVAIIAHREPIEVHHQKCVLVTLIAIASHCLEGEEFAIG